MEVLDPKFDRTSNILETWIEPDLVDWKLNIGRAAAGKISRKAIKIGSRVDDLIKKDIDKGKYSLIKSDGKEVASCMKAWGRFKEFEKPKIINHHQRIYHEPTLTTGEYDLHLHVRDAYTMTDIKCASEIRRKNWVQTAWYNFISKLDCPKLGILRLDPMFEQYELIIKPMNPAYVEVFKGMLVTNRFFSYKGDFE